MTVTVFDKIIQRLGDTTNAVHKYYTEDKPEKKGIYFCHHQACNFFLQLIVRLSVHQPIANYIN